MHGDLTGRLYNIFVCLRGPVNPMGTFLDSILERVTELFEELVVNKLLIGFRIALVEHRGGNSCIIFGIVHVVAAVHPAHATHDKVLGETQCYEQKKKKRRSQHLSVLALLSEFSYIFQKQELVEEDAPIQGSLL